MALLLAGGSVSLSAVPGAAAGDKILSHQRGSVQYTLDGSTKTIYTRLPVPDNATAITGPKSLGTLTLPDSSEIDIGERTSVGIGEFNPVESGKQNTINLHNGALHFVIRHPTTASANYTFVTPTSQIAIRGTEGFLISNAGGSQLTIVSGTAQVTAVSTGVTVTVSAGTTGVVSATGAASVSTTTSTLSVGSISGTTSATSATASAGVAGAGGSALGSTAAIAGGAAAAAGAVVASTQSNGSGSSQNSGGTPSAFTIGSGSFPATTSDVFATFPHAFTTQTITQSNCTGDATITATGPVTLTNTTLPCTGGSINAAFSGEFTGTGVALFTISGSGVTATHTEDVFGPISVSVVNGTGTSQTVTGTDGTFAVGTTNVTTVPASIPVSITQSGPSAVTFSSTLNCANVAAATNYNSFIGLGSPGTFTSSATSYAIDVASAPAYAAGTAPANAPPYACLLTIQGLSSDGLSGTNFDTAASEVQLQISVTTANIGLQDRRRIETSPGQRRIPGKNN
jgi:hypothetical protein